MSNRSPKAPAADPTPAQSYEERLRGAACALANRVRSEFPLFCKDPNKVPELLAVEAVLSEQADSVVSP